MVGAPDPEGIRGVLVKAFVVLVKGYEPSDELTKQIQDHVKRTTAPYKYPRLIEYRTELPKTISGKILRRSCAPPSEAARAKKPAVGLGGPLPVFLE